MNQKKPKKKLSELNPPNKKNRSYFTLDTQQAIIYYNQSDDDDEKNWIYNTHLEYPLRKLTESIINRFKFTYIDDNFGDLQNEVISFLILSFPKYDETRGLAYSFLSVIAKNYLIQKNNAAYGDEKNVTTIADETESLESSVNDVPQLVVAPYNESQEDTREFIQLITMFWEANMNKIFKKDRDIQIVTATLDLLNRSESIENFNKKAIFLTIREMTDCKSVHITKVVGKMKSYMEQHLSEFVNTGMISLTLASTKTTKRKRRAKKVSIDK